MSAVTDPIGPTTADQDASTGLTYPRTIRDGMLLAIVFFSGMTVLGVELTASRLLAPFYGNNLFVWANVIGLVLLYLTAGYYVGGRIADRRPDDRLLLRLVAVAAFTIGLVPLFAKPILELSTKAFSGLSLGVFWGSLFGVLLLFAIPITILGFVSPFAIRLSTANVKTAGANAGRIYALGTLGSILGAFLPVLLLVPNIGTRNTFLAFALVLLALTVAGLKSWRFLILLGLLVAITVLVNVRPETIRAAERGRLLYEEESVFNFIQVQETSMGVRHLVLNEGLATHSVFYPGRETQPLSEGPWDYFLLAPQFRKDHPGQVENALIVGLGTGTVSKLYHQVYGEATYIDGVEIDPQIIQVGRDLFDLNEPNLNAVAEDGRYFLRRTDRIYDVVAVDAYRQPYIPFQLTTREFFAEIQARLKADGVVAVNAGRAPNDFRLVEALSRTMRSVFPTVFVIDLPAGYLNSLIFASNSLISIDDAARRLANTDNATIQAIANRGINIRAVESAEGAFTDDLAPVEQVIHQMILGVAQSGDSSVNTAR